VEAGGRAREVHRRLDRGNGTEEHSDAPFDAKVAEQKAVARAQVAEGALLIRIEADA
jgi:hypothetical protein